jgi:hypothetical protein
MDRWPLLVRIFVAALALPAFALLSACSDVASKRSMALAECRLARFAQPAQCGTLEVPEDRAKPDGRKLKLFVAVLPANTPISERAISGMDRPPRRVDAQSVTMS